MPPPVEFEVLKLLPSTLPYDRVRSHSEATAVIKTSSQSVYDCNIRADWSLGRRESRRSIKI